MIGADTTFLVELIDENSAKNVRAQALLQQHILTAGEPLALAPLVLTEFIHIVTDARRLSSPLSAADAVAKAQSFWTANQTKHLFPTDDAMKLFFEWMTKFQLGRKRILDTQLAAVLHAAGVRRLFTSNPDDFKVFGVFDLLVP